MNTKKKSTEKLYKLVWSDGKSLFRHGWAPKEGRWAQKLQKPLRFCENGYHILRSGDLGGWIGKRYAYTWDYTAYWHRLKDFAILVLWEVEIPEEEEANLVWASQTDGKRAAKAVVSTYRLVRAVRAFTYSEWKRGIPAAVWKGLK